MKLFQRLKQWTVPLTLHLRQTPIVKMDTFTSEGDEQKFNVITDQVIGGESKGIILYQKEDKAVSFLGQIQVDKRKALESLSYVGMSYHYLKSVNIARFTKFMVKMRTDGQIYKIRIGINSSIDFGQQTAYAFLVDQSQSWNTYVIPINNFETEGFDKETTNLGNSSEGLQLYSLEILRESKSSDKVAVQIQEFAVSSEVLTEQEQGFTRPIFYKYSEKQIQIDTGCEKYNSVSSEQTNESNSKKHSGSVNSFYD